MRKFLLLLILAMGYGLSTAQTVSVYFKEGSDRLEKEEMVRLRQFLHTYRYMPVRYRLSGYANSNGTNESNLALSERRVKTVEALFSEAGIDSSLYKRNFFGEELPVYSNETAAGLEKNRRVDIQVRTLPIDRSAYRFASVFEELVPRPQVFRVDVSHGAVIRGHKGTEIEIPAGALVDASGKTVEGQVDVYLTEYVSPSDLVTGNVNTHAGGELLQTGGTIYIRIFQGPSELSFAPQGYMGITFPTRLDWMSIFNGTRDKHEVMNWKERKICFAYVDSGGNVMYPTDIGIRRKDLVEKGFAEMDYFSWEPVTDALLHQKNPGKRRHKVRSFGWINCDRFANIDFLAAKNVRIRVKDDPTTSKTHVMLVLPDYFAVSQCDGWGQGWYFSKGTGPNQRMNLPPRADYFAVAFTEKNEQLYFGYVAGNLGQANDPKLVDVEIKLTPVSSKDEIKELMSNLKFGS